MEKDDRTRRERIAEWLRRNAATITALATVAGVVATIASSCSTGGGPA